MRLLLVSVEPVIAGLVMVAPLAGIVPVIVGPESVPPAIVAPLAVTAPVIVGF